MKVDVARVLPTGATDVEPARAFLQDRIGLWAFWMFVLSFADDDIGRDWVFG
jgi:hypothetical protein